MLPLDKCFFYIHKYKFKINIIGFDILYQMQLYVFIFMCRLSIKIHFGVTVLVCFMHKHCPFKQIAQKESYVVTSFCCKRNTPLSFNR